MRTDNPNADARWVCARKKRYPTQALAAAVARKVSAREGVNLVDYGCGHCGGWHIGRASGGES